MFSLIIWWAVDKPRLCRAKLTCSFVIVWAVGLSGWERRGRPLSCEYEAKGRYLATAKPSGFVAA